MRTFLRADRRRRYSRRAACRKACTVRPHAESLSRRTLSSAPRRRRLPCTTNRRRCHDVLTCSADRAAGSRGGARRSAARREVEGPAGSGGCRPARLGRQGRVHACRRRCDRRLFAGARSAARGTRPHPRPRRRSTVQLDEVRAQAGRGARADPVARDRLPPRTRRRSRAARSMSPDCCRRRRSSASITASSRTTGSCASRSRRHEADRRRPPPEDHDRVDEPRGPLGARDRGGRAPRGRSHEPRGRRDDPAQRHRKRP